MSKSTSWLKHFITPPINKTLDKNQKKALSFSNAAETREECIEYFKSDNFLCLLAVAPISKELFVFHHFTKIGGSLSDPTKKLVA
eukprot:1531021-Ditylum_brightwellii.AAC.1